ncbi:MAG: hypothetical protein HEEMFOPI_01975 [Holosporales bacterium]
MQDGLLIKWEGCVTDEAVVKGIDKKHDTV